MQIFSNNLVWPGPTAEAFAALAQGILAYCASRCPPINAYHYRLSALKRTADMACA